MSALALDLSYSRAQARAFFREHPAKFNILPKGRRGGFTRGGMQAACEWALEGQPVLWGDTISSNIRKYVERYALPVLREQRVPHTWNVVEKTLRFPSGGFIDLRSADRPENWEGFGYKKILLNEAGLILEGENGRYLYQHAVLPMLLDYPESELYAFGVPKGTASLYHELWQRAVSGADGYHTETFTSYDNPWLSQAALESLVAEMRALGGDLLVDQEIFGRFVNVQGGGLRVIPESWVRQAFARWEAREAPSGPPDALGVDVARGGRDKTVLAPRWGTYLGELITHPGITTPDGPSVRDRVLPLLGPGTRVGVDIVGVGSSPFDFIKQVHAQAYAINGGLQGVDGTDRTGQYEFANLRAKLYWQLREALDPDTGLGLALPPDEELLLDLTAAGWEPRGNKIIVEPKKAISARLGRSPDKGDAITYALYEPPTVLRPPSQPRQRGYSGHAV